MTPILRITFCFVSAPLFGADRTSAVAERLPGDVAEPLFGARRTSAVAERLPGDVAEVGSHDVSADRTWTLVRGWRAPTAKLGLGPGKQRASFVQHSTAGWRPRRDAKSKKEGSSFVDVGVDKEPSKDVFDKLLDKLWDWCKDAEKPVSVQWAPVGEAERIAKSSKERVVNLKMTTEAAAEKMLNLSRDLGFLWHTLPDAIDVAKGLLEQIGEKDGVLDRLVVAQRTSYLQMAMTATELIPPLWRLKKALDIPLGYGRDLAKTAGEIRELILGVPKPAENAPSVAARANAALAKVTGLLSRLSDASAGWGSPDLGKRIGRLKESLDGLDRSLVCIEKIARQRPADTLVDKLGQVCAIGSGARLTPEEDICEKMLRIAQRMANTTRYVRDIYTNFRKGLDDFAGPFTEIREYVCDRFEALGVSVTNFFTALLDQKTSDEEARRMLSNEMLIRVISS